MNGEFAALPRVSVCIQPSADRPLCRYGLEQVLRAAGVRYILAPGPPSGVYYGTDETIGAKAGVWIPADGRLLAGSPSAPPPRLIEVDGVPIPLAAQAESPTTLRVQNRLGFDLASAAAFWLTLTSEQCITERDAHDRVPARASLLALRGNLAHPPVLAYAKLLADCLVAAHGVGARFAPRWPEGKRYAVALTHDVDAPEQPRRIRALLGELLGGGRQRPRRHAYWDLVAEVRRCGLLGRSSTASADSSCWDFAEFCALERGRGLRSAFNFAVVNREKGHPNDVRYDAGQPKYRRLMRELLADGWEVGLHAAYLTAQGRPPPSLQYERLAEWTGCQVRGVRHHYLQLQSDQPLATLLAHAEAGAAYDSSMGFNDSPGFRAGTALPFEVFDPRRGLTGELLELPMSIADMHLPRDDERAATECVLGHLAVVRELGGLAVLNWHVGNWHSARGWRESYLAACELLAQDAGAWVAPPRRIAEWWRARSAFLDECSFAHRNLNKDMKLGIVRADPAKHRTAVAC